MSNAFRPPSDLRGDGPIRGPLERHIRALQAAVGRVIRTEWEDFTPVWKGSSSNPSIGNGDLLGRYQRIGDTVRAVYFMRPGSTTTFGSGVWSFSLPVTSVDVSTSLVHRAMNQTGLAYDSGDWWLLLTDIINSGAEVMARTVQTQSGESSGSAVSPTVPFTWATNDQLRLFITYEALN